MDLPSAACLLSIYKRCPLLMNWQRALTGGFHVQATQSYQMVSTAQMHKVRDGVQLGDFCLDGQGKQEI